MRDVCWEENPGCDQADGDSEGAVMEVTAWDVVTNQNLEGGDGCACKDRTKSTVAKLLPVLLQHCSFWVGGGVEQSFTQMTTAAAKG